MINNSILTGIVTFNPDLEVLHSSLQSLLFQRTPVLIVDNGSKNKSGIDELVKSIDGGIIRIVFNAKNQGIAAALNQIMSYGKRIGAEWVLTLDKS